MGDARIDEQADDAKAATGPQRVMCDHICLLDEGHVERGELHFHGYELPSPRELASECEKLKAALAALVKACDKVVGIEPKIHEFIADELWVARGSVPPNEADE